MPNKFNAEWEQDMLKEVPKATDYVKAKTGLELEMYRQGNSAIKTSLAAINGDNSVNNQVYSDQPYDNQFINGSGAGEERANVRVRKLTPPGGVSQGTPNMSANNNYNYQNYGVSGYDNSQPINNSMSGAVSALILVGVAALIILVVVVSMFIMNGLEF